MRKCLLILFSLLLTLSCDDNIEDYQSERFLKLFCRGEESISNDVIELPGEGYVFTGYDMVEEDKQLLFVRTDIYGNELNNRIYGSVSTDEEGLVVKQVSDGFIIGGVIVNNNISSIIMKLNTQGDSIWSYVIQKNNMDVVLKDFLVSGTDIYATGYEQTVGANPDPFFVSMDLSGEGAKVYRKFTNAVPSGIFQIENDFVVVGNNLDNDLFISKFQSGLSRNPQTIDNGFGNMQIRDAVYSNDHIFLLSSLGETMKVVKMDTAYSRIWQSEISTDMVGKSMTVFADGSLMVFGETVINENYYSQPVFLSTSGNISYGDNVFKIFSGQTMCAVSTMDNGIVFSGCTNATNVQKARLVKTGSDLFLLKPQDPK
ncbi:MAG TPA: hypothetical protein VJ951_00985 [Bacteroidales bacterium]|nr:hypothetical protein [Bacteroidales bacterium]